MPLCVCVCEHVCMCICDLCVLLFVLQSERQGSDPATLTWTLTVSICTAVLFCFQVFPYRLPHLSLTPPHNPQEVDIFIVL